MDKNNEQIHKQNRQKKMRQTNAWKNVTNVKVSNTPAWRVQKLHTCEKNSTSTIYITIEKIKHEFKNVGKFPLHCSIIYNKCHIN